MGATILLADDSVTIQKVIELTFAETDHFVVAVGSGRELLDRMKDVHPDAVLCDVVMPDMNGYDICQDLKSDPNTLHIPVVLLTGTFEPFDRTRALAAGCDAIVTKPFEAEELIRTVEELLRRRSRPEGSPAGGLEPVGIPEGAPSLDFTTTGFERMGVQAGGADSGASPEALDFEAGEDEGPRAAGSEVEEDGMDFSFGGQAEGEGAGAPGSGELPDAVEAEGGAGEDETFPSGPSSRSEGASAHVEGPELELESEAEEGGLDATVAEPIPRLRPSPSQPPAPKGEVTLSAEQIEAIAHKVLDLATPMIERIAWEVIPDMAEMLVRRRIRELEETAEQEM
jgi:CheY-like chemotaxis protein